MQDLKILVVDDERDIRDGLKDLLERDEYKVDTAIDGNDALEKVKGLKYQLVISDIIMPRMSGIDLLEQIKSLSPFIEIIMITGHSTFERTLECIEKGAIGYIEKPFENLSDITNQVKRAAEIIKGKKKVMDAAIEKIRERL